MKLYIASSWKNEQTAISLAWLLRNAGHEVDCFCDPSTGRYVFHWSEVGNPGELDAICFLQDRRSQKAFIEDKSRIDWAEAVIMLHPCGNSSHLEAGYAVGSGKLLYMLGAFPKGQWDVMYGFANGMFRDYNRLFDALERTSQLKRT